MLIDQLLGASSYALGATLTALAGIDAVLKLAEVALLWARHIESFMSWIQ